MRVRALDEVFGEGTEARLHDSLDVAFSSALRVVVEAPRLPRELVSIPVRVVVKWFDGATQVGVLDMHAAPERVWVEWVEFSGRYRRQGHFARAMNALRRFFSSLGVRELAGTARDETVQEIARRVGFESSGHLEPMHLNLDRMTNGAQVPQTEGLANE